MLRNLLLLFGFAVLLSGCLPASGPTAQAIVEESRKGDDAPYQLVDIDSRIADLLHARSAASLSQSFRNTSPPPEPSIGVGDSLAVTIWEAGPGGLFSAQLTRDGLPSGPKSATIPEQVVGTDGTITVPYAGRLKVAGRSVGQVEDMIVASLTGKAIEPQVLVSIVRSVSNSATVLGEVVRGSRVALSPRGDRVLDVIATAGGANSPLGETFVRLTRDGRTETVALSTIVARPTENIYVRPGDSLVVVRDPQTYVILGASGAQAEIPFNADGITLAQALAKAGGLADMRANPTGVFVFRYELANRFASEGPAPMDANGAFPVVYRLNMRDPNSLFLAQRFPIEDTDLIYISNAPVTDVQKGFQIFQSLTAPVATGIGTYAIAADVRNN